MMKRLLIGIVVLLLFTGIAQAATETSTLLVEATVNASCSIGTTAVTFVGFTGAADVLAAGEVNVQCSPASSYNIALDAGGNFDGAFRNISTGAALLTYGLLQPASLNEWGDSDFANTYTFGTSVADTGDGSLQSHVVDATLFGIGGPAEPGYYSDIVNVTVHF